MTTTMTITEVNVTGAGVGKGVATAGIEATLLDAKEIETGAEVGMEVEKERTRSQ